MAAPLSIVIPTLNSAAGLSGLLHDLMAGLQEGLICEVIFADGGSTDATHQIAEASGAEVVSSATGRGFQLSKGMETARGAWILIVHSDSQLPDEWVQIVSKHMQEHGTKAGYFRLRFDAEGPMARVTASWANMRSRVFGLPYGDQGLLISRKHYQACGGYPDIPLMEDVAIARRLRRQLRPLPGTMIASAARYQSHGWISEGTRNVTRLVRFLLGAKPEALAKTYTAEPSSNCK